VSVWLVWLSKVRPDTSPIIDDLGLMISIYSTSVASVILYFSHFLILSCFVINLYIFINRPYAYALSLCLRRVSFAIQKGLALQLTSSPAFIPTTIEDVFEITWLHFCLVVINNYKILKKKKKKKKLKKASTSVPKTYEVYEASILISQICVLEYIFYNLLDLHNIKLK
jgi:hypothetical protein